MATHGNFTSGVARLQSTTALQLNSQQVPQSCSDVYAVWLDTPVASLKLDDVTGLPAQGAAHPTYRGLFSSTYSFAPSNDDGGCQYWQVTVEYAIKVPGSSSGGEPDPEIDEYIPPINYGSDRQNVPLVQDADTGETLLNSAGEPFNGVPSVDRGMQTLSFSRREARPPTTVIEAFSLSVNKTAITVLGYTIQPGCGLIEITTSDPLLDTKFPYEYQYSILIRKQMVDHIFDANGQSVNSGAAVNIGHHAAYLQQGYHYRDGNKLKRFMEVGEDGTSKPTPDMCMLTATGGDNRNGTPVNRVIKAYQETEWSVLKLPEARPTLPKGEED